MKKLFVSMLATLLALTTLTACRGTGEKTQTSDTDTTAPADVSAELADEPITEYNLIRSNQRNIQYYDGYLYFYVGSSWGRNSPEMTLFRYNVRTGNLTTVCSDPLCQHSDRECPFHALMPAFAVYDNKIIYSRYYWMDMDTEGREAYSDSVCYDLKKNKMTTYYSAEGVIDFYDNKELYVGNYRFYRQFIWNEESQEAHLHVCRMDLTDGSVTVFTEDDGAPVSPSNSDIVFAVDEKLYFCDGKNIFYTDLDLQNAQIVMTGSMEPFYIVTDGEYMYWGEKIEEGTARKALYRAKLDGSEKTSLGIEASSYRLTENYIYYEDAEKISLGEDKRQGTIGGELTSTGTALYRAAHDGSGQEKVFDLWQGDTYYELSYPYYCVDDKLYAHYYTYTDADQDGAIRDDEYFQSSDGEHYTILCVDLTTGEMDYIYCGTEPQTTP